MGQKVFISFHTLSMQVWMQPMPPTNKNLTYNPDVGCYKTVLNLREKLFAARSAAIRIFLRFLRLGLFLTFNPGWTLTFLLSWSFYHRFSTNSPHISPCMDHKRNTNSLWTHYIPRCIPAWNSLEVWSVT